MRPVPKNPCENFRSCDQIKINLSQVGCHNSLRTLFRVEEAAWRVSTMRISDRISQQKNPINFLNTLFSGDLNKQTNTEQFSRTICGFIALNFFSMLHYSLNNFCFSMGKVQSARQIPVALGFYYVSV